jgi:magnesium transporter
VSAEREDRAACHIIQGDRVEHAEFTADLARGALSDGGFFWLDLYQPRPADFQTMEEVFGFHRLAIQASEQFGQRAKIDDYDDFVFIIVYGASPDDDKLVEVHCFYSERFLVTVHRDEAPAFTELRVSYEDRHKPIDDPPLLIYRLVNGLVDSFFPVLAELDDRIDDLENETFTNPTDRQSQEIFAMKRLLVGLRKAITPERDMFASLMGGVAELPGMTEEHERYFRDIYDHLIRISDLIDTYRDLLTSSMDVFLSTVSNRLNVVMKQLTVIATVFLPLTFLTGFFGQNFGWLVRNITGFGPFLAFGLGLEAALVVGMLIFFKRRGWF